jgi:hypothetical protein
MKNDFKNLCESINTTIKLTKIYRYPKQIQFSEEFTKALQKEVARHMQILDESKQPIKDLPEKFLKALRFELSELTEGKKEKKRQIDLRPRQKWEMNPATRINPGKKGVYDRAREKREWNKE